MPKGFVDARVATAKVCEAIALDENDHKLGHTKASTSPSPLNNTNTLKPPVLLNLAPVLLFPCVYGTTSLYCIAAPT